MFTLEKVKANMLEEFGDEVEVITIEEANSKFDTELTDGMDFNEACNAIEDAENSVFYADGDPESVIDALKEEPYLVNAVSIYFIYSLGFAIGIVN